MSLPVFSEIADLIVLIISVALVVNVFGVVGNAHMVIYLVQAVSACISSDSSGYPYLLYCWCRAQVLQDVAVPIIGDPLTIVIHKIQPYPSVGIPAHRYVHVYLGVGKL
jgi:hypothetical protein